MPHHRDGYEVWSRFFIGPIVSDPSHFRYNESPYCVLLIRDETNKSVIKVPVELRDSGYLMVEEFQGRNGTAMSCRFTIGENDREFLCRAYWDKEKDCQCLLVPPDARDYIIWHKYEPSSEAL